MSSALRDPETARIRKHSVVLAQHRTSISIEDAFWTEMKRIAGERGVPVNALIVEIDAGRTGNLSSAVRLFVLGEVLAGLKQGRAA